MSVIGETVFSYKNTVQSAQFFCKTKKIKIWMDNSQASKITMLFAPGNLLLGLYLKEIIIIKELENRPV